MLSLAEFRHSMKDVFKRLFATDNEFTWNRNIVTLKVWWNNLTFVRVFRVQGQPTFSLWSVGGYWRVRKQPVVDDTELLRQL